MSETETLPPALRGSDGAKPGKVEPRTDTDRNAYDADARAKAREAAPITVDGREFYRRRKNWQVTRQLRQLLRVQERASLRQEAAAKKMETTDPDDEQAWDRFYELQDELSDRSDDAAYEIIALLLKDEDGNSPSIELLKGDPEKPESGLDVEDVGALAAQLSTGREPDPTPPTPSTSN